MHAPLRFLFIILFITLIDWYFFQAILTLTKNISPSDKTLIIYSYWGFSLSIILFFLIPSLFPDFHWAKHFRIYFLGFIGILFFSKLFGSLFLAMDDIYRLGKWVSNIIIPSISSQEINNEGISRLQFFSQLATGMAAIPFLSFIYGMVKGAFDYKIHTVKVTLPNLPSSFNGIKVLQISDIHAGSFVSTAPLQKAVDIINQQNADLVFFTGDLVNDRASEVSMHMDTLSKIAAPLGVYSVLGNHDYGDYAKWDSPTQKANNLEELKNVHEKVGWKLLMNEHVPINKDGDSIAIIGIENWGGNLNFPKYGDLKKAYSGAEEYPVQLLLSHDPSHWNAQVQKEYPNIDITFSGHTHGFQFGIEIPGLKWSPSQYFYKQWAGLYKKGKQYLYVNRGLGFLGYPGRVGISPEITVLELSNKENF